MADDNERRPLIIIHRGPSGLFVGLFLIALGVMWLLSQQGIVAAHRLYPFFWPAVFVFFGLELMLGRRGERGFGAFLFAVGVVMTLSSLGYLPIHFSFATVWPILLVGIGVAILFNRFRFGERRRRRYVGVDFVGSPPSEDESQSGPFNWFRVGGRRRRRYVGIHFADSPPSDAENQSGPFVLGVSWPKSSKSTDSTVNYSAVFSAIKQRVAHKNFKGGEIVAVWGGFQLDLTGSEMEGGEAVLDITTFMGGGELRIPENWSVEIKGYAFLGAFRDETKHLASTAPGAKRLVVQGTAVLGGVVIKN